MVATSKSIQPGGSRESILAAAGEVFSQYGYEAATIKEITDRAGANVASVNYYFRDKLGLYTELLRRGVHDARLTLPPEASTMPPEQRLKLYIRGFINSILTGGRISWCALIMIREMAHPTPALPQIIEEIIRPNYELLRGLVSEVAGAPLPEEAERLLAHSVIAQCGHWKSAGTIFPYLWPDLVIDDAMVARITDHIAAFSIAGIRAIAASHSKEAV